MKQNQNNLVSVRVLTILSLCSDTEPGAKPNMVTANHFSACIVPAVYSLKFDLHAAKQKPSILEGKHNFQAFWPEMLRKCWTGELLLRVSIYFLMNKSEIHQSL